MKDLWYALLTAAIVLLGSTCGSWAQSAATTVASCGAASYAAGQQFPLQQTQTGTLCTNAVLSGSVTVGNATIAAPLGAQTSAASVATTINGPLGTQAASAGVAVTISKGVYTASSALAANQIVVTGAHQLVSFDVAADSTLSAAAWWIMVYDATAAPGDGAVTPAKCYALPSGTTTFNGAFNIPVNFATGVVIGVSTTGCFTKTASTHAFISGDYQ